MATTTNFGWETPDDTDLVKDGALAIRTLGSAIDTSLVDLKGGTTGQVLSKTSNTDMDFTWVTSDDANAIQNAIVDAKGDLIAASAADTPARLAVGNNGETLVADSSATTGLRWQGNFAAGKNKIINGSFDWWQRGTSFTLTNETYTADRFKTQNDKTGTISQQTFTAGTAPVSGYEGRFYLRSAVNSGGTYYILNQMIEDVRTFAGQTITVSYWARVSSGSISNTPDIVQNFGSGGSASVRTDLGGSTITTTWTRFSHTLAVPSISGKTIGTGSALEIRPIRFVDSAAATIDVWGVQVEAGAVATAFQTATGTLAGELAACQRYYERITSEAAYGYLGWGKAYGTGILQINTVFKVTKRVAPTALDTSAMSTIGFETGTTFGNTPTSLTLGTPNNTSIGYVEVTKSASFTNGAFYTLFANNSTTAYIGWSAEL